MSKKLSTASESELETRLHHLTENLIQKQTLVESLSTEKNSLKLQLERSEQQCRDMEASTALSTAQRSGAAAASSSVCLIHGFKMLIPNIEELTSLCYNSFREYC